MTVDATESIAAQKARMRTEMRGRLDRVDSLARCEGSALAGNRLLAQEVWCSARTVGFFVPLPDEMDVWLWMVTALESGKNVALPAFDPIPRTYGMRQIRDPGSDLGAGRYGVMEPGGHCGEVELNRLDLILVPGLAFDVRGHRLGRGKGYFDRMLEGVGAVKCGVGLDEQIVDYIPVEPHDEIMTCILTPTRWIRIEEQGRVVE